MDHYKVLEVSAHATASEIRTAYKRLAKIYHPDVNSSPHAKILFQHIGESYKILSDPERRKAYDASRFHSYTYTQQPPVDKTSPRHKRNPASYRAAPLLKQEDLIKPYIRYAYALSYVALVFALLLAFDFFGPPSVKEEILPQSYILPGASFGETHGRPLLVFTEEGTRMELRAADETLTLTEGILKIEKTPIFNFPKNLVLQDNNTLQPLVLIYGHLSFFPLLLFAFGVLGSFVRQGIVFDFNVGLLSGILLIITSILITSTL